MWPPQLLILHRSITCYDLFQCNNVVLYKKNVVLYISLKNVVLYLKNVGSYEKSRALLALH